MKKLINKNAVAVALLFVNTICLAQGPDPDAIPGANPTDAPLNGSALILISIALLFASYKLYHSRKLANQ